MPVRSLSRFLSLLAVAGLCALAGCGDGSPAEDDEHDEHEHEATGATCPTNNTLNAQNFGTAFMQTYCLSCHSVNVTGSARGGAPEDKNYDTLDDVRHWSAEIDEHAAAGPMATNTAMPPAPNPQPTTDERIKLGQWLACGAP